MAGTTKNATAGSALEQFNLIKALPKLTELKGQIVLIKYGGNAMIDDELKKSVATDIAILRTLGLYPVVVHGGGPAIKKLLSKVGKQTEFIGGQRKTDQETMGYVEMVLSGQVNSEIVKLINANKARAVGLSGKDGNMVTATKRMERIREKGKVKKVDLGQVGSIKHIDTTIITDLINSGSVPVIAPIGVGKDLMDYNINADVFAGHMAAALKAKAFFLLTDVDGLMEDPEDPDSLIPEISVSDAQSQMGHAIQGGMIPKVDSCIYALNHGVTSAHILNGTTPHILIHALLTGEAVSTKIVS